jgi:HNH endonuclease
MVANSCGFIVEIYKDNLTYEDATILEKSLIKNPNKDWDLVNSPYHTSETRTILYEDVFKYVQYCPETAGNLIWKVDRPNGSAYCGNHAGFLDKRGVWRFVLNGITYQNHRVIYLLHHGSLDVSKVIDHIDGNNSNNRIENLREVILSINNKNRKSTKQGLSEGYITSANGSIRRLFYVQWSVDFKKQNLKRFFYEEGNKLSRQKALELATSFRDTLILQGFILTRKV